MVSNGAVPFRVFYDHPQWCDTSNFAAFVADPKQAKEYERAAKTCSRQAALATAALPGLGPFASLAAPPDHAPTDTRGAARVGGMSRHRLNIRPPIYYFSIYFHVCETGHKGRQGSCKPMAA